MRKIYYSQKLIPKSRYEYQHLELVKQINWVLSLGNWPDWILHSPWLKLTWCLTNYQKVVYLADIQTKLMKSRIQTIGMPNVQWTRVERFNSTRPNFWWLRSTSILKIQYSPSGMLIFCQKIYISSNFVSLPWKLDNPNL